MASQSGMLRRFLRQPRAVAGAMMVLLFVLIALAAPLLTSYDPEVPNMDLMLEPPSLAHPFGMDEFGRDVLTRILHGTRISLQVGLVATAIATTGGILLGVVSGYFGGWLDGLIMRLMDVMLAFPGILLALAIVSILGQGLFNVMIAVGIFAIPTFARVVRSSVLQVRSQDYVEAAKALGGHHLRIIWKHVLPNCMAPVIVVATMRMATAIVTAAGLSFLGLGAQPPTPEWGAMLANGREYLRSAPHVATFPGLAIMTLVLAFNLMGDGLRDALDPRLKA